MAGKGFTVKKNWDNPGSTRCPPRRGCLPRCAWGRSWWLQPRCWLPWPASTDTVFRRSFATPARSRTGQNAGKIESGVQPCQGRLHRQRKSSIRREPGVSTPHKARRIDAGFSPGGRPIRRRRRNQHQSGCGLLMTDSLRLTASPVCGEQAPALSDLLRRRAPHRCTTLRSQSRDACEAARIVEETASTWWT